VLARGEDRQGTYDLGVLMVKTVVYLRFDRDHWWLRCYTHGTGQESAPIRCGDA
jgi:hypothetical protein